MKAKTRQSCADTLAKMEALLQVVNVYLEVGAQGSHYPELSLASNGLLVFERASDL